MSHVFAYRFAKVSPSWCWTGIRLVTCEHNRHHFMLMICVEETFCVNTAPWKYVSIACENSLPSFPFDSDALDRASMARSVSPLNMDHAAALSCSPFDSKLSVESYFVLLHIQETNPSVLFLPRQFFLQFFSRHIESTCCQGKSALIKFRCRWIYI